MHLVECVLCIWYSVYRAFGTMYTVHLVQCVLCIWYSVYRAYGTVRTMHLVQCLPCIWYNVYRAYGTVCTVHLVQCVLCILQNSIMFNQQMHKQFVITYLLLAAFLHVPIPKYLLQKLFVCYSYQPGN